MVTRLRLSLLILVLLGMVLGPARPVIGQSFQGHQEIQEEARRFLLQQTVPDGASLEVEVNPLDNRLRLDRCDLPLEAFLPPSARKVGRVTVGIRCAGAHPWSVYLPTRVQLFAQVAVARQDLERGAVLREEDLEWQRHDLASLLRGYILTPQQAVGRMLERPLGRGAVLVPRLLQSPHLVQRGAQVSIVAYIGGIEARMQGKALARGSLGERIRVLSLSSGKELDARVISATTVQVDI